MNRNNSIIINRLFKHNTGLTIFNLITVLAVFISSLASAAQISAAEDSGTMFYASASMTENEMSVMFSEKPIGVNFESTEIINTENEKKLKIGEISFSDKQLKIAVSETESACQYLIILPDNIKSDRGSRLSDRYLYAVSPALGSNTQHVKAVSDTFEDYQNTGANINVPSGWLNRNRSSLNYVKFYSDAEHDNAVKIERPMSGWTETCFTRNFGKTLSGKFTIEFDFNPLYFNKYIDGEEDPALLKAVVDSVNKARGWTAQNGFTYKYLNANMSFALAPVAENGEKRYNSAGIELKPADNFWPDADMTYVSSDKLVTAQTFFQLYGNRLGFAVLGEQPEEGHFVRVEKENWYHIKLDFDLESLKVSGEVDGTSIGTVSLPSEYADKEYGSVAARAMLFMRGNNNLPLENDKATYIDSRTGEEKTYVHKNSSSFAIDNFDVIYTAPEFKICGFEMLGGDKSFGPLNTADRVTNLARISFTLNADINTLNSDNFRILNSEGGKYGFKVSAYDSENYIAEIELDRPLKNGDYIIESENIMSENGALMPEYTTRFSVKAPSELYISDCTVVDGGGAEVKSAKSGDEIFLKGYALNETDKKHLISAYAAAYKTTEKGLGMTAFAQKTAELNGGGYISFSPLGESVKTSVNIDSDLTAAGIDNTPNFEINNKKVEVSALDDTIEVFGDAKPNERIKIEIPTDDEGYASGENKDMFFCASGASDENGRFEFKINAESLSIGKYAMYLYNLDEQTYSKVDFSYTESDMARTAIDALNNTKSTNEIKSAFTFDAATQIGVNPRFYLSANIDRVVGIIKAYTDKQKLSDNDLSETARILNEFCLISAIDNGKIENLFDYDEILNLGESEIKSWYKKDFISDKTEKNVTADLKNGNYKSENEFYEALVESFVLNSVAEKESSASEFIIPAFASKIGLSKTPSSDACAKVSGKKYGSYSELKTEIEKADKKETSGGRTSGGGGGGGVSAKTSEVTLPDNTDTANGENVPLDADIFDDINDVPWAKQAIVYLAENGIINGASKYKFLPNDFIKREELVKIVAGAFTDENTDGEIAFEDVDASKWYYPFILRAYNANIISGYDDKTFGTGDKVSREDMAVMLYRAAILSGKTYDTQDYIPFEDDELISDYAKEAVYCLKNAKIINGTDSAHFSPKDNATRAEAAKIIYGLLKF